MTIFGYSLVYGRSSQLEEFFFYIKVEVSCYILTNPTFCVKTHSQNFLVLNVCEHIYLFSFTKMYIFYDSTVNIQNRPFLVLNICERICLFKSYD